MSGKYMRFSLAAAAAVLSGSAFAAMGPKDYIQDGLVALFDAEFNSTNAQGVAIHDASATTWVNLVPGTGDIALPASGVTIAAKTITLSKLTVTAPNCTAYDLTTPVTLESCARSVSTSTDYKYDLKFVNIVNRAGMGWDARSKQSFVLCTTDVSDFTKSKLRYFWFVQSTFKDYAPVQRTYSAVVPVNGGNVYANGLILASAGSPYTGKVEVAPTGGLELGNVNIDTALNCVRIYNRELTEDERQYNNAVDAARFRGATQGTITPYGYNFDADGNVISPYIVKTSGTVTIEPGDQGRELVNKCTTGAVAFDETAYPVSAANAIGFLGFDALCSTSTTFLGGWWDFGAGDFFSSTSTFANRTTVFDGSVVTNVGAVHVAGTSGDDNRLDLKNGAKMYPASMTLGWKNGWRQRSKVTVTGGSTLEIAGKLNLSDAATQCKAITITENELLVSNANSRLVVKGTTGLAQKSTEGTYGATGGNTLIVTDKAVADLQTINVSRQNACNVSNRITVAKGGLLTSQSLYCSSDPSYSGFNNKNFNTFEVLEGGIWTNRNAFQFGQYQHANHDGNTLLVSNGTFHTKYIGTGANNTIFWFQGRDNRIIISGPKAKFTVESVGGDGGSLFCNPAGAGSELIVENNADWTATAGLRYTYMEGSTRCALVARSGGIFRANFGFTTGTANSQTLLCKSVENAMRAESDGQFIISGLSVVGNRSKLVVDNGRMTTTTGGIGIGHYKEKAISDYVEVGSNCVMRLSGDHPAVTAAGTVSFATKVCSTLEVNLPAAGYLATHACSTQALVMASTIAFGAENASIVLNGAEAFAAHQAQVGKSAAYVLLSAPTLTIPEYVLTAAQATLPSTCRLFTRTVSVGGKDRKELVLRVSANRGMVVLIK